MNVFSAQQRPTHGLIDHWINFAGRNQRFPDIQFSLTCRLASARRQFPFWNAKVCQTSECPSTRTVWTLGPYALRQSKLQDRVRRYETSSRNRSDSLAREPYGVQVVRRSRSSLGRPVPPKKRRRNRRCPCRSSLSSARTTGIRSSPAESTRPKRCGGR